MIITADNPQILKSIHSDLNKQNIKAELAFKDIDGTKGDIPTYINLATLGVTTVGTVIGYNLKQRVMTKTLMLLTIYLQRMS